MFRTLCLPLIPFAALLLSACGGSSNSDVPLPSDPVNDPALSNNAPSETAFCSPLENTVTYEPFNDGSLLNGSWYVPLPVTGIGWTGNDFCDQDNSRDTEAIAVLVPQVAQTSGPDNLYTFFDPVWASAAFSNTAEGVRRENLTNRLLESTVSGYQDGARSGDWRMVHDASYLYIQFYARAEGSSSGNPQIWFDSVDPRDDDSVEIFIDADNSKNTSYDGVNDFHIIVAALDTSGIATTGPNSAGGLDAIYSIENFNTADTRRVSRYIIAVNLESAGISPGVPFGFEIQLNDDDNGGVRDAKFGWHEPSGSAVAESDPSVFGTLLLTTCADAMNCGPVQQLRP